MTDTNDPMPAIRVLLKRLSDEANSLGLIMGQAMIIPSPDGNSPDLVQAMFMIKPEAVHTKTEQELADERAVEEMFRATQQAEVAEKNTSMADEVKGWLEGLD